MGIYTGFKRNGRILFVKNYSVSQRFQELRKQGDLHGAAVLLESEISGKEGRHHQWHALLSLSIFALEEGYFDQAIAYCSDLGAIDAKEPEVYQLNGMIYRLKGQFVQAEKNLRYALELKSEDVVTDHHFVVTTELGKVLFATDRLDECEILCTSNWNPYDPGFLSIESKGENLQVGERMLLLVAC